MTKPIPQGHCVREFNLGATKIKICDDCCSYPDQEERDKATYERIANIIMEAEIRGCIRKEEDEK